MATSAADTAVPPIPFVVASWLGYSPDRIVAGLRRGSIAPPLGAAPGWLPPGSEAPDVGADGALSDGDDASAPPATSTDGDLPAGGGVIDAPADAGGTAGGAATDSRTTYRALVSAIDPAVGDETFDALWRSGGDDDAARAAHLGDLLWRTVTGAPAPSGVEGGDAGALAAAIAEQGTRGTLVSIGAEGSEALAQRARSDPAALGALSAMDAFAFTGAGGGIARWRFDPATGEALVSDAWIDDRAKYVAWRQALADDPAAAQGVGGSWRFADRTLGDGATILVGDAGADANQVVFARDGGDRVVGGATVDRIHGGDGDDVLRGADGDDLVEGAIGDDILSGGSGHDRVDGGTGADELAGGSGNDRLDGGSGDDVLDGGRGDDTLLGGDGHDVYELARGDGIDRIADADGDGEIRLDGERLTGEGASGVSYVTRDDGAGGTTLVIRTGDGDDAAGEIRIRDWHQGMFGIRIEDVAQAVGGAQWTGASDSLPQLKPLLTGGGDPSASAIDAPAGMDRESGNESGSVAAIGGGSAAERAVAPRDMDELGALDFADWSHVMSTRRLAVDDAVLSPPAVDPGSVTAADLASALAGAAADHDDTEAAGLGHAPPIWPSADDWSSAFAPPEAPARPLR